MRAAVGFERKTGLVTRRTKYIANDVCQEPATHAGRGLIQRDSETIEADAPDGLTVSWGQSLLSFSLSKRRSCVQEQANPDVSANNKPQRKISDYETGRSTATVTSVCWNIRVNALANKMSFNVSTHVWSSSINLEILVKTFVNLGRGYLVNNGLSTDKYIVAQ